MQITPFGRIEVKIDDLPRVSPTTDNEFSRRLRETGVEIKVDTPEGPEQELGREPTDAQHDSDRVTRADRDQGRRDTAKPDRRSEQTERDEADTRVIVESEKAQPQTSPKKKGATEEGSRLPFKAASEEMKPANAAELEGMSGSLAMQGFAPAAPVTGVEQAATSKAANAANRIASIQQISDSAASSASKAKLTAPTHKPQAPKPVQVTSANKDSIFKSIAFSLSEGKSEALLLIEPPHLGALSLKLSMKGNELFLQISAERPEVAAALKQDLAELKDILQDQGLNVLGFEVRTGSKHDHHRQAQQFNNEQSKNGRPGKQDGTASANGDQGASAEAINMQRRHWFGTTVDFIA